MQACLPQLPAILRHAEPDSRFPHAVQTPFVTVVAVLSLALGIGANAAIFSLFDQMLLRPLPVPQPERLVNSPRPGPKPGSNSCNQAGGCDEVFSYPMFRDLEKAQDGLQRDRRASRLRRQHRVSRARRCNGDGMLVSGSYFPVLGIQPALGRLFTPDDDRTIGGHFVAVLSYAYWADAARRGSERHRQAIIVNGQTLTIIGVAPEGSTARRSAREPTSTCRSRCAA